VPDKVAANPPILTLIHYCGETAQSVFGQARGIVAAADQYGFIMIAPSSGRCWDISSAATQTRNGGGDSHAIVQMVRYVLGKYQANANRVYSTGDSSGAMMTELLLALYPDIYKAGSAFAGSRPDARTPSTPKACAAYGRKRRSNGEIACARWILDIPDIDRACSSFTAIMTRRSTMSISAKPSKNGRTFSA
jgi:poly(hydroxyalkanoate) depolymerase family esterase